MRVKKITITKANPQTGNPQTKNRRPQFSGKFPVDLGVPPLETTNEMLESNPLKSRVLVCGLAVPLERDCPITVVFLSSMAQYVASCHNMDYYVLLCYTLVIEVRPTSEWS